MNSAEKERAREVILLGGGMAGLSVGYHLMQARCESFAVYEAQQQPGGLARSFTWHDIACDLAPHRLFSENKAVLDELLGLVECNVISRRSKIVLNGKTINDPINIFELLRVNFPLGSLKLVASYLAAKLRRNRPVRSFDDFVKNAYGNELNALFFKPYAEKLFGIPASEISSAWGERKLRVSGLKEIIRKQSKLYFSTFHYPRQGGYGAFCDKLVDRIGQRLKTGLTVIKISYDKTEKLYECHFRDARGEVLIRRSPVLVSTLPLSTLLGLLGHSIDLNYRKMRLVYLHVNAAKILDQQWVYFIDQHKLLNRISEFKNFYPQHPNTRTTVLCAEMTARPDCSNQEVVDELVAGGIIKAEQVLDIKVIDLPRAYPVYDIDYEANMARCKAILSEYPNLLLLGRQAEFIHQDIDEIFYAAKSTAAKCAGLMADG